jgi:hypothetical protein
MISNLEKQKNYKTQFSRLNKAMNNAFYLEAIFIEYAIMEDRAESILSYEGYQITPKNEQEFISFTRKKNRITKLSEQKNSIIGRYFSDDLLQKITAWVNERNSVIHALLKKNITTDELRTFAERGEVLCKEFRNRANNYKRMVARKTKSMI